MQSADMSLSSQSMDRAVGCRYDEKEHSEEFRNYASMRHIYLEATIFTELRMAVADCREAHV